MSTTIWNEPDQSKQIGNKLEEKTSIPAYDNSKIYKVGDKVSFEGKFYIMIDGIGDAGYPPPRPTNWKIIEGFEETIQSFIEINSILGWTIIIILLLLVWYRFYFRR